jgi:hypothetical protein
LEIVLSEPSPKNQKIVVYQAADIQIEVMESDSENDGIPKVKVYELDDSPDSRVYNKHDYGSIISQPDNGSLI